MPQAQRAHGRFAHGGERLGQQALEVFSSLSALAESGGKRAQLFVGLRLHLGLEGVDLGYGRLVILHLLALTER